MKTICAVRFLIFCATQDGKKVQFHIPFDIMERHLPFFIRLSSLKTMAGTLSFMHKTFSMVINKVLYRIQLVDKKSLFYLPLRPKSSFLKTLGDSLNMVLTTSRRPTWSNENSFATKRVAF